MGGPAGLAVTAGLAAAAWLTFSKKTDEARSSLAEIEAPLESIKEKFESISRSEQRMMLNDYLKKQTEAANEAEAAWKRLMSVVRGVNEFGSDWSHAQWRDFRVELEKAYQAGESLDSVLQKAIDAGVIDQKTSDRLQELASAIGRAWREGEKTEKIAALLSTTLNNLEQSASAAAGGVQALNNAMSFSSEGEKYLSQIQAQIKALQDGGDPVKEATRWIEDHADATEADKVAIMSAALARKTLMDAQKAATQSHKDATAAAREHQAAIKALLDTHLPENKALEDLHKNLDLLQEARASGIVSATDYDKALRSINLTYANSLESTQKQIEMERILGGLRAQQSVTQLQFMRELESFGQGDRVRELNADLAKVEDRYRDLIEARRNSAQGLSDTELAQIRESLDRELEMVREYHDKKLAIQGDWKLGALDALRNYADEAANVYSSVGNLATSMFKGMEDALTQFVTKGKIDFKGLADSIIQDMVRITIQQSITGPLAGAFGNILGSMFGPSSAPSGVTPGLNWTFGGRRANGGPVEAGKMYEVNERGIPELLTIGNKQLLMMAGQGGRVTPLDRSVSAPALPRMPAMATPQINVNVHGAPGQPEVTQRRNANGGFDIDIVFRQIESRIAGGIASGQGPVSRAAERRWGLTPQLG